MIEVRTFEGDAAELSRFTRDVWQQSYQGRMLFPLWEPEYLDWQLPLDRPGDRDFLVAVYDGARLVGTDLATVYRFRLRQRELDCTIRSWFTVHPDYRRRGAAMLLIREQRRRHLDRGVPLTLGYLYDGWSGSLGPQFVPRLPGYENVAKVGFWTRLLDHSGVAARNISRAKSLGARALGLIQGPTAGPKRIEGIRPYHAEDLPACLELAHGLLTGVDLGCVWTPELLAHQLEYQAVPRTFVIEKRGRVAGFVNYHRIDAMGRDRIETAMIDILALSALNQRDGEALVQATLWQMAQEGVKVALVMRQSGYSSRTLLASGFIPMPPDMYIVAGTFEKGLVPGEIGRLHMPCR